MLSSLALLSLSLITIPLLTVFTLDLCHPKCDCLDTVFDCRKRGLAFFPDDFPSWVQTLNVSGNEIYSIENQSLAKLKDLQVLAVDGNNLTEIPRLDEPLRNLIFLGLSRNSLEVFDYEDLRQFPSVQELDLSRNRISTIINNLSLSDEPLMLRVLNLGGNQVEVVEEGTFNGLSNLVELVLSRNKIRTIPKDLFSKMINLEKLDMSRNKFEVLDSLRFQELNSLQMLNLRRNGIRNLSDAAFYGLDKLQHLYLDGNRIQMVERRWLYGLRSLRTMSLSSNSLENIQESCWEGMEELQLLDLSWNKLTKLSRNTFNGLLGLRHLDLSNNQVTIIGPDTFLGLRNLENLDLSHNSLSYALEDASSPFKGLEDCRALNLAANNFQTLHSEGLKGLSSLILLNITSNPVKWLQPETFMKLPNLVIHMHNVTTFICDCHATWLHSRLSQSRHNRGHNKHGKNRHLDNDQETNVRAKGPLCALPSSLEGRLLTDVSLVNLTCSDNSTRPKFLVHPFPQTFLKEGNGSLFCISKSHSSALTTVTWLKDHQTLPLHVADVAVKNFERVDSEGFQQVNSSLGFSNISWADAGGYQCVAQNGFGVTYSSKANVTVHIFPHFVKRPANITVRLGSNAKLECGAKGYPLPEIAFQKGGGVDFPAAIERRFHVMPNDDSFMILDTQLADMGTYCCSAKNSAGEVKACASVTVYETPRFSTSLRGERVVEGGSTVLECSANGSPRPQITWSKDNVIVHGGDDTSRIRLKEDGSLLVIKDARLTDAGRYECILSNAVGTARDFLVLSVIPNRGSDMPWNSSVFTIALSIVVTCCVMMAVFVGFLLTFRDKRRQLSTENHSGGGKSSPTHQREYSDGFPFLSNRLPDVSLHSYNRQEGGIGIGGDIPFEVESIGTHPEVESLMGTQSSLRRGDGEYFSTFGHKYPSTLSNASSSLLGEGHIIFPNRGRGTLSLLRKVAIPVPPTMTGRSQNNHNDGSAPDKVFEDKDINEDGMVAVPRTSPCGSSGAHFRPSDEETNQVNNPNPTLSHPNIPRDLHHNLTDKHLPLNHQKEELIMEPSSEPLQTDTVIPSPLSVDMIDKPIRKAVTTAV